MAKAILLNALHDTLSDYVVGLSPEKLKVGVWSGKIVLDDLQVNPEAVNQLRLPVTILHGTVKKLEVHIPWGHLGSKPVKVFLEGVCVLVGPVDKESWGDDEVTARRLGIKRAWLEKQEMAALKKEKEGEKGENDSKKEKGFVEKLVQRVVDNIEINVADIHIRYEDTTLVQGQTVSAGLSLRSFVVTTTDEKFEPRFVDRTKDPAHNVKVHKVARVDGFSIYWRVDDKDRYELLPPERRFAAMRAFVGDQAVVPAGDNGGGLERGDILRPTKAVLKFIHNNDPDDPSGPMFEALFEMDDVRMDVRAEQYEQALALKDSFAALANWQTFFPYRPKKRPMEDPRGWWRYAYVCVRGRPGGVAKMIKIISARKEYLSIFKRIAATESNKRPPPSFKELGLLEPLSPEEQKRLDEVEADLPLESILMFRKMSRSEVKRLREEANAAGQVKDEEVKNQGWFGGWWGGGGKKDHEEGDVALEDLGREIEGKADAKQKAGDFLQVRVKIRPRGAMRLYGRRDTPLVQAHVDTAATMEMREDSSMRVTFSLTRLEVKDLFTDKAMFQHLLKIRSGDDVPNKRMSSMTKVSGAATPQQGGEGADPLVTVNVAISKTTLDVEMWAVPTEVVYNRECVDAMLSVFQTRSAETEAYKSEATKGIKAAQKKAQELVKLAIVVAIDVAAPKIIVPVSSTIDKGYLLLDTGHAVIQGGTVEEGNSGMKYRMQLNDITLRLPSSKQALMETETGDALVAPFKIQADVSMGGDSSKPGIALGVELLPGFMGTVSPPKIRNLFSVLDYVTKADLKGEDGPGEPPLGLTAPSTGAGGGGVQIMGGLAPADVDESDSSDSDVDSEADKDEKERAEAPVMMEIKFTLPTVSLLLVEAEDVHASKVDKGTGLLMELRGMALELHTRPVDMSMTMHLESLTLEDRARPDDSPFRYMMNSTPDESSHGGLIHISYWMAVGGARVPPAEIAQTDKEYNIVLDARFSTLGLALDKDCILTSTPFFRAITRQDAAQLRQQQQIEWQGGSAGVTDSRHQKRKKSHADVDTKSVVSSAALDMIHVAKRVSGAGDGPPAMLVTASLTSVSFELVRSGPWETTMKAEVAGLGGSFCSAGGEAGEMEASVTLVGVELTDVRPEAKNNAFRGILAPLRPSSREARLGARDNDDVKAETSTGTTDKEQGKQGDDWLTGGEDPSVALADKGKQKNDDDDDDDDGDVGGKEDKVEPVMKIAAKKQGTTLDVNVKLASFACNLMVEPIKESLVVLTGINEAVLIMLGQGDGGGKDADEAKPSDRTSSRLEALDELDEDEESEGGYRDSGVQAKSSFHGSSEKEGDRRSSSIVKTPFTRLTETQAGEGDKKAQDNGKSSSMNARCTLDDWRINLIETPSIVESKVMVMRASVTVLFTRFVTSGDGGESVEDTAHLSLVKVETLVDQPSMGDEGGRNVHQMLEPFSAEVHSSLLSARGSLLSASVHMAAEAVDCRLSYRDMMLVKGIVEQATAAEGDGEPAAEEEKEDGEDPSSKEGAFDRILSKNIDYTGSGKDTTGQSSLSAAASASVVKKSAAAKTGVQPAAITAISITGTCALARVVLVNDYEGQGVPVLSFASRELKAEGNGFKEDFAVELSGLMEVSFFNIGVVRWEPIVERWRPVLKASLNQNFKGRMAMNVDLSCEQVVTMNVTSAFLESFLSTSWMLFSDGGAKDDPMAFFSQQGAKREGGKHGGDEDDEPETDSSGRASPDSPRRSTKRLGWAEEAMPLKGVKEGSVYLKNRSGLPLVVSTTDHPEQEIQLGPMDTASLPFETARHRESAGEFDLRGKAALVKWGEGGVKDTREDLPPLQVDQPGTFVYPLQPVSHIPHDYVVAAPVVVEVYQDQRFQNMTRRWRKPYMPGDGPEFWSKGWAHGASTEVRETPLDSITLPDNEKWEWRDEWHVDFSKTVGKHIDASGWEYAVDFGGFNLVKQSRTHRELDQARRRRWIRTRAPKPLPLDDPYREMHVAWEITATPQGRLEATIRSPVQIVNRTDIPLEVRALCSAWTMDPFDALDCAAGTGGKGTMPLGSVVPGCTLDVPVKLVYASQYQLRPLASSGGEATPAEYTWGTALPLLANGVDTTRNDWVSCAAKGGGGFLTAADNSVRLVVHAETTESGCVKVTVLPPVMVVNCLPCPVSFRAVLPRQQSPPSGAADSRMGTVATAPPASVLESGTVPTAEKACLHSLEVGDGAKLSVKIAHHGWSAADSAVALLPCDREELRRGSWSQRQVFFKIPTGSGDGGCLEVRCQFEPLAGPACPAVRVYLYCTHWLVDRSGLSLGFGVSEKRRLPVPRVNPSAVTTARAEAGAASATSEFQQARHVHLSPISELSCASTRVTTISTARAGNPLFTDREYTIKADSLPSRLRGATMIRTACSDKNNDSQHFLRFRTGENSTVHVLYDRRCPSPPSWLTSNYRATAMRAHVSHKASNGKTADNPFVVWTRNFSAGSWVNLGGNKAPKASTMYFVIVTEEAVEPIISDADKPAASSSRRKITSREDLYDSWALGTEGLVLCNAPDEEIRVAIPEGAGAMIGTEGGGGSCIKGRGGNYVQDDFLGYTPEAWSDELAVTNGSTGVFQVDGTRGEVYELALRSEACPGTFRRTTQVTIVPRYCVVNLLDGENIWLKQPGAPDSSAVVIPPGGRAPWHWMMANGRKPKKGGVRVRTEGTAWSYGDVMIDSVGTTALHIPFFGENEDLDGEYRRQAGGPPMKMPVAVEGSRGDGGGGGTRSGSGDSWSGGRTWLDKLDGEQAVVHVDVKLADDKFVDEYAVLVVFWKANDKFSPIYSVQNASGVNVRICQAADNAQARKNLATKAVWKLKPGDRRQVGWAYPSAPRTLLMAAGTGPKAVELNTETIGNYAKIPTGMTPEGTGTKKGPATVWARVVVTGGTKVIRLSARAPRGAREGGGRQNSQRQQQEQQPSERAQEQPANVDKEAAARLKQESEAPALEIVVNMAGFGLSLVGPIDGRRQEFIYAQVSDVRAKLSRDRLSSLQASVGSMQVDNHLPDGLYPVLVSGREDPGEKARDGRNGKASTPFLQLSIIKEVNKSTNTAHFDYVAFRMLEIDVMADRASVLRFLALYNPVAGYLQRWRQQLDSRAWVAKLTAETLERSASETPGGYVDVDEVRRTARIQRKYFKTLRFHPIILRLSYARTQASNELYEAGMAIINKIPTLLKSSVDLASFLVEDAFGTVRDISKNVISHYTVAASMQVLNLIGSIRALGSPADLISNVGGGAKALVYAPALGLVQGPAEFFEGVGRGAQSFVKGTVHGVFNSVAGVGGAASDIVSMLSFDEEYQSQRERDKNKNMAKQGGVGQGFVQGGKNITGGIASGVGGIFTTPVRGAKKGGMAGFFKGVGQGLVGAVVKPVVGVGDAAVSVVQGISNQADDAQRQEHLRPPRALRMDPDTRQFYLENFSMEAAEAQALIQSGGADKGNGGGGKYESHTSIADLTIIFADTLLVLVKRKEDDRVTDAKVARGSRVKSMQMVSKKWEEVARVDLVHNGIVIRRYEGGDITLRTSTESSREELYRQFYAHRQRMGDPTAMRPPTEILPKLSGDEVEPLSSSSERTHAERTHTMKAHSNAVQQSLLGHSFGSVNRMEVPYNRLTNTQILNRAEKQLESVGVGNWTRLDMVAWELVQNWNQNNTGLNTSRCVCVVFINASSSTVQFLSIKIRDGLGYRLLIGPLCDHDTHQLKPGGVAILFAWAHAQTNILKKGYIVMTVETSAFSAVYAVQREKVTMTPKSGFQAGFLEKSMAEWWSKQVVVIK